MEREISVQDVRIDIFAVFIVQMNIRIKYAPEPSS